MRNQGPEHDKKHREKKHNKHEHISSSDSNKPKKKEKSNVTSKANMNTTVERTTDKSDKDGANDKSEPALAKAGSAEKSAAESLNLLQQMPGLLDYFPNGAEPKTPLNSMISGSDSSGNASSFNMVNILSSEQETKNRSSPSTEEFIDVVDTRKASDSNARGVEKSKEAHKSDEKHKGVVSHSEKSHGSGGRATSQTKKPTSSHSKGTAHSKSIPSEGKKRKSSSSVDAEKGVKKKKIEEKRKVKTTIQKSKDFGLPRPSKVDLFENDRIPSLFPRNFG